MPVSLVALRILDFASLDDDAVTGSTGRSYGTIDVASVHSLAARC